MKTLGIIKLPTLFSIKYLPWLDWIYIVCWMLELIQFQIVHEAQLKYMHVWLSIIWNLNHPNEPC